MSVTQGLRAEQVGFEALWISDHYHPWNGEQGQSPFVWSVLGATASRTSTIRCTTAVTAPTLRIHPAVVAQAAATTAVMFEGRFGFGVGTGEALNEHIFGDAWPTLDVRLEMLEEAVDVIRRLWTGELVRHRGTHYTVDTAQLYRLPDAPVPVLESGFGPKATELAARIGDGYLYTSPNADMLSLYRELGGRGPTQGGLKPCWAEDEAAARRTVHRLWANEAIPGKRRRCCRARATSSSSRSSSPRTPPSPQSRSDPAWRTTSRPSRSTSTRATTRSTCRRSAPTRRASSPSSSASCDPPSRRRPRAEDPAPG